MENFTNYLLQFGQLNAQQIALIQSKLKRRKLLKNEYLIEAGQVARELAFVEQGVMRVSFYNNKGEDVTHYFITENNVFTDIDSYQHRVATMGYLQAVTDCELITLHIDDYEELAATILNWDLLTQKITSKVLLDKHNKIRAMMMREDAQSKYEHFLQAYPNLVNRVSLVHIASFLGITPSSLSRIRRIK